MSQQPAPSQQSFVWSFWGTLAWSAALFAVMAGTGVLLVVFLAKAHGIGWQGGVAAVAERANPALLSSLASIAALGPLCLVIYLAVRRAHQEFCEYLALRLPSRRHFVIGMLAITALLVLSDSIARMMHWPITSMFLVDGLRRDSSGAMLLLMALSLILTTPIAEEIVFRGFIYRGFAAGRMGPVLAVILSSVMFAALHVQYDLIGLAQVLASGLLLGSMRAISGSTILTIAMHALVNTVSLIEAVSMSGIVPWIH